jgi:hypothetical protein
MIMTCGHDSTNVAESGNNRVKHNAGVNYLKGETNPVLRLTLAVLLKEQEDVQRENSLDEQPPKMYNSIPNVFQRCLKDLQKVITNEACDKIVPQMKNAISYKVERQHSAATAAFLQRYTNSLSLNFEDENSVIMLTIQGYASKHGDEEERSEIIVGQKIRSSKKPYVSDTHVLMYCTKSLTYRCTCFRNEMQGLLCVHFWAGFSHEESIIYHALLLNTRWFKSGLRGSQAEFACLCKDPSKTHPAKKIPTRQDMLSDEKKSQKLSATENDTTHSSSFFDPYEDRGFDPEITNEVFAQNKVYPYQAMVRDETRRERGIILNHFRSLFGLIKEDLHYLLAFIEKEQGTLNQDQSILVTVSSMQDILREFRSSLTSAGPMGLHVSSPSIQSHPSLSNPTLHFEDQRKKRRKMQNQDEENEDLL